MSRFGGKFQLGEHGAYTFITLHWFSYTTKKGVIHLVPKDFVTDGATIPRFLWSIIGSPFTGLYKKAVLIHDELYFTQKTKRRYADKIFLEIMKYSGVAFWKRIAMYSGVSIGGWYRWNKQKKKRRKK